MKWIWGLFVGALIWVLIFVELSVIMFGLHLPDFWGYLIHYVLLILIMFLCATIYYRTGDTTNGFFVGLYFLVIVIALDMIITVPLFIIPVGGSYTDYFSGVYLLIGYIWSVFLVYYYRTITG